MLPQEVELLPENDLIVFRRGMYPTYGTKVRYYAEKRLAERTRIPAPQMPQIRVDPAVAANSLRVIEATQVEAGAMTSDTAAQPDAAGVTGTARRGGGLNQAAIDAARAVPPKQRVAKLFEGVVMVHEMAS